MKFTGSGVLALALVAGAGVAAWYVAGKLKGKAPGPDTFNPMSDKNIVYRGANSIASTIAGREETVGGLFYEWTHNDDVADMLAGTYVPPPITIPDLTVVRPAGTVNGGEAYDILGNRIY